MRPIIAEVNGVLGRADLKVGPYVFGGAGIPAGESLGRGDQPVTPKGAVGVDIEMS